MLHLFDRTYLEHDVFYNTKYNFVLISSVEKAHPISEKVEHFTGRISPFKKILDEEFGGDLDNFWADVCSKDQGKKKILFADGVSYLERFIEYYKSVLDKPEADLVYQIYSLQHADTEVKLLMNIDRADNFRKLRPGQMPKVDFKEFEAIYDKTPVIKTLRNRSKEDLGFEILLSEFHISPNGTLGIFFLQRLIRLTWRSWLSDLFSMRNDLLGTYYYLDQSLEVKKFIQRTPLFKCFMDPDFSEQNPTYILKNYKPDDFKEVYYQVNPNTLNHSETNPWNNFLKFTEMLFEEQYLELLKADIQNKKGCTYLRNHLANESNQLLASMIYEDIRTNNLQNLKKFKLA